MAGHKTNSLFQKLLGPVVGCAIAITVLGGATSKDSKECTIDDYNVQAPSPAAIRFVDLIADTLGISRNFEILSLHFGKRTSIAFAIICQKTRYIVYDSDRVLWFEGQQTDWTSLGILVHEIAHHINGDTAKIRVNQWDKELKADYLAGFVIARLGGSLSQATAFTLILSEKGSPRHPPRARRTERVRLGWQAAMANKENEDQKCLQSKWKSTSVTLNNQICRSLSLCTGGQVHHRIACLSHDNLWFLQ